MRLPATALHRESPAYLISERIPSALSDASFITLSMETAHPPLSLLTSAAVMKANNSIVSSALTGGFLLLKNSAISTTKGSYPP